MATLSVAVYVLMVPVFWHTKGTYGILALLPVMTISLLYGSKRGAQAGAVAFAMNVALEHVAHRYSLMLTTASGLVGNTGMVFLGWLVGYLRDLSQSRLREVVEDKDRLIGTISHELRTPLSIVVGLSHELADRAALISSFQPLLSERATDLATTSWRVPNHAAKARCSAYPGGGRYQRLSTWYVSAIATHS